MLLYSTTLVSVFLFRLSIYVQFFSPFKLCCFMNTLFKDINSCKKPRENDAHAVVQPNIFLELIVLFYYYKKQLIIYGYCNDCQRLIIAPNRYNPGRN